MDETMSTPQPDMPAAGPAESADFNRAESGDGAWLGASAALLGAVLIGAAVFMRHVPVAPSHYLLLSLLLFTTGAFGVLVRRNALVLFMCIELMLNAANVAFVAFARMQDKLDGQVVVLFVMIVAAAEVAVGLAIMVSIFRRRASSNVDDVSLLRW